MINNCFKFKLWKRDFIRRNPNRQVDVFYRVLDNLGVRANLWPEVYMVMIYAEGANCKSEIYDRHLDPIKQ